LSLPESQGRSMGRYSVGDRGYFGMTSGTGTTDEMIRQYIKEQRDHKVNDQPSLLIGDLIHDIKKICCKMNSF
jgi:hypothetical protein